MTEENRDISGLAAIHKAIDKYYEIIASPDFVELNRLRSIETEYHNDPSVSQQEREQASEKFRQKWNDMITKLV